jgi:sulfide dehydrogenase cytochrome subunit
MGAKELAFAVMVLAAAPAAAQSPAPPPGVASCSGCHPPAAMAGIAVPPLYGRPAAEIITAMQGFRTGQLPATVMDRIAKGFSDDETRAIAAWFAAQK